MDGSVAGTDAASTLMQELHADGFELQAVGDRLQIRPSERVTPELRERLAERRAELLSLLTPREFVSLKNGPTLPLPVLQLAWSLETRGFALTATADGVLTVTPVDALTGQDRAAITRWRSHLVALTEYCDEVVA